MTRLLLLLLTTLVLSACGGGAGTDSPTSSTDGNNSGGSSSTDTPTDTPQTPISYTVIDFDFQQKSNNREYRGNEVQSTQFSNATGSFLLPLVNQDLTGNITVGVKVADPDGLSGINLAFTGSGQAISLCSENCGLSYDRVVTGVNLVDFDLTSGDQRLELWVNDSEGNQVLVNTVEFDWQATSVMGINATRSNNSIDLSWNRISNYLRYNVYIATEPGVTPQNYQDLADGQAFYALSDPSIALAGKEDSRTFYTTVTGIDGSGESAFGELVQVMAIEGAIDLPPTAVNDIFSVDEDQALTGNLIANDSDLESGSVTIKPEVIVAPENGDVTINQDGTFSYQPKPNFSGRDAFSYEISDGLNQTDQAYAVITIAQTNDAPQPSFNNYNILTEDNTFSANAFSRALANNGVLSVSSPGVMSNDLDIDSSNLTLDTTPVIPPTKGEVVLQTDGSFVYTVDAGQSGEDSFTYRTIDDAGGSEQAVVTITINGDSFPPRAANDIYFLEENQTFITDGSSTGRLFVTANDTDEDEGDEQTFTVQKVFDTANGISNLDTDGRLTYIPNAGFYGTDSFVYRIIDAQGNVAQAAGILHVAKKNSTPIAESDTYIGQEDTTLTISAVNGLLNNDFDQDFDTLTAISELVAEPANGEVNLSANGGFDYVPNDNFFGTDTFTYAISDGQGGNANGTVTITIENINDAPNANDDVASTTVNSDVTISVLANDTDIEGDSLIITEAIIDQSAGSAVIDNDASIVYIPATDFEGFAQITYTISDGNGGSDSASVSVAVNVANSAPIANNDSYSVNEDSVLNANGSQAPTLLANDTDIDGDSLSVLSAELLDSSQGFLTVNPTGRFTYRPDDNFFGQVQFTYEITDGNGGTDTATATINVVSVNDEPEAQNDQFSTAEETLININVLANDQDVDGDTLTISSAVAEHGLIDILADNTINYTPELNFVGEDEIDYQISDGNGGTDSATALVVVVNVNDDPIAVDDEANTAFNTRVTINVLANDSDIDGDALEVVSASASSGSVEIMNNQRLRYTPNDGFSGSDTIIYTIGDGNGGTATANVSVAVETDTSNQSPIANNDLVTFDEDSTLTYNVLNNDSDPDGDTITLQSANSNSGTLAFEDTGNITFTPPNNFNGQIVVDYTISDGRGGEDSAELMLSIAPVNDAPTAQDDVASVDKNSFVIINVLANDSDIDGDTITLNAATASFGNAIISDNQTLVYQPNNDFVGNDTITYTIADSSGLTDTAQVAVTVNDVSGGTLTANNDVVTVVGYEATTLEPLANDSDSSGSAITLVSATVQTGSISIIQNRFISYQAPNGFVGTDEILYIINNAAGDSASATIFVTVESGVNLAPIANPDSATTDEDVAITIDALANDSDPDGDALSLVSASANNGAIVLVNNRIQYTPNTNVNGQDTISYTIKDTSEATASSTVTVTINPVNDAPVAANDQAQADEDSTISIAVLANDSDVDGDALTVIQASAVNGVATINQNGTIAYTGNLNFNGTDTINYTIEDPSKATAQASVTVIVSTINDNPVAVNDQAQTDEDSTISIAVLANDSDADGDALTVIQASAANGLATINPNGTIAYTGNLNFNGTDTINYTIEDPSKATAQASVTVIVNAINDDPVAVDDQATVDEDTTVVIAVLNNDSDVDGDNITISQASAENGMVTIEDGVRLSYQANQDFYGADTINYTITDTSSATAQATVALTINAVNDNPVVVDDQATVDEDTAVTIDALSNDSDVDNDSISITLASAENGTVTIQNGSSLSYQANQNFNGTDTINYTVTDSAQGQAQGSVAVTINPINDAPVAVADVFTTPEDTQVILTVLINDTDVDEDTLTISAASAESGTVNILDDQTLSYEPPADFSGDVQVQYTISDGELTASSSATVRVGAINDLPIANPDTATTKEDEAVIVDAIANDTDAESEVLSITTVAATNGQAIIKENKIEYTPNADFNGEEIITYAISDGEGGAAESTVTVTITPVNDLPVAVNDTITINEDFTTTIDVLANDSDVDGDALTITIDQTSSGGSSVTSDNKITYSPASNEFGEAQIVYIINDGQGGSASAIVTITIEAVNDAPIAINDFGVTQEDQDILVNVTANDADIEGDTLSVSIISAQNGLAAVENNQVLFTPTADFNGETSVIYLLSDSAGGTDEGIITITVIAVNDPPVARNDNATTSEDSSVAIDILGNDTDVDNDTLTILAANAGNGSVVIENNNLSYTPTDNFNGSDVIDYLITDTQGVTAGAQVLVTVNPTNDAPIAVNDQYTVSEDVVSTFDVLNNDSDIDVEDELNIVAATTQSGTVVISSNEDGQFLTYTPQADFNGTVTIDYTISDNNCSTLDSCNPLHYASASATLTINPVNDVPVTEDASVEIAENVVNGYSVHTITATDVDEDTLTYAINSGNLDSAFGINSDTGEITVVDKSGLSFNIRPQYVLIVQVSDPQLASAYAQVTIDLTKVTGNQTLVTDTSFGNYDIPGISLTNAYSFDNQDKVGAGTIDSLDRAILAGSVTKTKADIVLTRYLADGSLDHSFGQQGVLTSQDATVFQNIKAAITDSSNNIYVVGESFNDSSSEVNILLAKVTSSGQFDSNFGTNGIFTTALGKTNIQVNDLIMHSNGNIYVAATIDNQFAIYEFNASDGAILQSNLINIEGDFEIAMAIAEQSDGMLLVAGHSADSTNNFNYDFTVVSVSESTLTLDPSFGTNGQVRFDLANNNDDYVHDMLIAPNGDVVLVGATSYGSTIYDVALAQMDSSGVLNTNIGNQGIMIIDADGDSQNLTGSSKAIDVSLNNGDLYLGIEVETSSNEPKVGAIKITSGGVLDTSYGTSGIATIDLKSGQENLANLMFDSSNQLLMAAAATGTRDLDFVLARLTSAGATDTSFNQNGSNFTNLTPSNDHLTNGIELQYGNHVGKIVMAGSSNSNTTVTDAVVARYTSSGSLDTSFGDDGYWRKTNNNSNAYQVNGVAQLTDGRIVVGGSDGEDAFIALLTEQGQLDTSFTSTGIKTLSSAGSNLTQSISAVGVHNNQITFAGSSRDISNDMHDIFIGRINVNGSLDSNYANAGVLLTNLGQNEVINNMVLLSDGAMVVVGLQANNADTEDSAALIAKFTNAGQLDTSFNNGYLAIDSDTTVNDNQDELFDIEVDSAGILYASGSSMSTTTDFQLVLSITANGTLNSQFSEDGIGLYEFGTSSDSPSLTLNDNQQPVITGLASNTTDGGTDVFIVRLATDGQIDPLFNNGNAYITSYSFADDVSLILNIGSNALLIAGDFPASQLSATAWYMHKLTLIDN